MRAESIKQIREHLARGGLVTSDRGDVALYIDADGKIRYESPAGFTYRTTFNKGEWELLPLEEKPTRQYYYRVNGCLAEDSSSETCICWHDEGTGPLKDRPDRVHDWRDKPKEAVPVPGIPASSLPLVTEDPTGKSWKHVSCKRRHHELRAKVLFGQPWSIEEQLEVWELLTGEKIEHGKRCERCECTGSITQICKSGQHQISATTVPCSCDNGYTVRPTWMGEVVR